MEQKVVAGIVGAFAIAALLAFGFHSYNGVAVTEAFSFWVDDGWCDPLLGHGVGSHCFGDFGYPYSRGGGEALYREGNGAANNTPLVTVAFLGLQLLSYNAALVVYLGLFFGSVFVVVRQHGRFTKTSALVTFPLVLLSIGIWSGFDRANHALLFLPLVYFLISWTRTGRTTLVTLLLVCAGLLKWWGPLLVLIPLAVGYVRVAILSVLGTVIGHIALLLIYPESDFLTRVRLTFLAVTDSEYAEHQSQYAVSAVSFVGRVVCAWPGGAECQDVLPREMLSGGSISVSVISLLFAGSCFVLIHLRGLDDNVAIFAAGALCFLAVPEAVVYNLSAATASALLIRENFAGVGMGGRWVEKKDTGLGRKTEGVFLGVALGCSIVPLAFVNVEGLPQLMPPFLGVFGTFRFAAVAVPLSSIFLFVVAFTRSLRVGSAWGSTSLEVR